MYTHTYTHTHTHTHTHNTYTCIGYRLLVLIKQSLQELLGKLRHQATYS